MRAVKPGLKSVLVLVLLEPPELTPITLAATFSFGKPIFSLKWDQDGFTFFHGWLVWEVFWF